MLFYLVACFNPRIKKVRHTSYPISVYSTFINQIFIMYSLLYISLWSAGLPGLLAFPQALDPRDGIAANPTGTMPSGSQGTGTITPLSDLGPAYVSGGSCPGSGNLTSRSIHDLFARAPCQFSIENKPHPWHEYENLPPDSTAHSEYLVDAKLGRPGQAFRFMLDTGSTLRLVPLPYSTEPWANAD